MFRRAAGGCVKLVLPLAALIAASSCSPGHSSAVPAAPLAAIAPRPTSQLGSYIKHVVVIVQENRSFENVFAGWPHSDAPLYGYSGSTKIALRPITYKAGIDLDHSYANAVAGWDDGKMDGFSNNQIGVSGVPAGVHPYSYLSHTVIGPYRILASQYVLADHMFPTMFGPSFTAHLDLIAGTTNISDTEAIVDLPFGTPWGCDASPGTTTSLLTPSGVIPGGGPFPCFIQFRTMADTLDAAHVTWKYYAPNILKGPAWSPFDAIKSVRFGPDWRKNVVSPQTKALTDPGTIGLPSVTWVTPDYLDSDHPETRSDTGPSWVADVVNAIGTSSDWNSTAIVVVWDDWGGWYDNAPPPQPPFSGLQVRLGIRVPCLIVSPYAKSGYVSQTNYEFGSILKFIEQANNLPLLGALASGYTDGRAASLVDSFDFTQKPRSFKAIAVKYPPSYFLTRKQSLKVPDRD